MKKLKAYECVMRFDVEPIRRAYTKKEFKKNLIEEINDKCKGLFHVTENNIVKDSIKTVHVYRRGAKCRKCGRQGNDCDSKITILWGEAPEDGQKAITYRFQTMAELSAFIIGIEEMDGCMGYEEVEEGYVHKLEKENKK